MLCLGRSLARAVHMWVDSAQGWAFVTLVVGTYQSTTDVLRSNNDSESESESEPFFRRALSISTVTLPARKTHAETTGATLAIETFGA